MKGAATLRFVFNNGGDKAYEAKLNRLLSGVFFDFGFWFDLNLWDSRYESYAAEEDGEIVANVCALKTDLVACGEHFPALSVGAVATDPAFRGRGLARYLLERLIDRYAGTPMYLFANDEVLDFYPRFGFRRVFEKRPFLPRRIENDCVPLHLDCRSERVRSYLWSRRAHSGQFDCLGVPSVNMFHLCAGYLTNDLYEIPDLGLMIVARKEGSVLKLFDVVSPGPVSFSKLCGYLPFRGVERVEFGFMPDWMDVPFQMEAFQGDTFFVRDMPRLPEALVFPELAIT